MFNRIKIAYLKFDDPKQDILKHSLRTALAGTAGLICFRYSPQWQEGYWIVLAAIILLQIPGGKSLPQRAKRLLSYGVITTFVSAGAALLYPYAWGLALYLASLTLILNLYGTRNNDTLIAGSLVILFAVMSAGIAPSPHGIEQRSAMIILGMGLALLALCLWPHAMNTSTKRLLDVDYAYWADVCAAYARLFVPTAALDSKRREKILRTYRCRAGVLQIQLHHALEEDSNASLQQCVRWHAAFFNTLLALSNLAHNAASDDFATIARSFSVLADVCRATVVDAQHDFASLTLLLQKMDNHPALTMRLFHTNLTLGTHILQQLAQER